MTRLWLASTPQAIAGLVLLTLPLAVSSSPPMAVLSIVGGVVLLVGAACAVSLYRAEEM